MKLTLLSTIIAAASSVCFAGSPSKSPAPVLPPPDDSVFGRATLGGKFSDDLQSGYLDVITGLSVADSHAFFLNLRGIMDDADQEIFNAGLGFRVLLEDPGVILGANVYYDNISSAAGNNFNQLGLGAEVLSKWVDARFNYYLPEGDAKKTGERSVVTGRETSLGDRYREGNRIVRDRIATTEITNFDLVEVALEGWNAEVGFLVPGIEKFVELRLFAGVYGYDNPAGGDFEGFKARAEARINRYITLDFEYWDDKELVGGNWVAGFRVSHPFDLGALLSGHNPFRSGPAVTDLPSSRSLRTRMDEMVMRSHRVYTTGGSPQNSGTESNEQTTGQQTVGSVNTTTAPPPSGGSGEEQPD